MYSARHHPGQRQQKYVDDASIWGATHSHARQTSSFHFEEYFHSSHFGQESIAEMQNIFIEEIKHITLPYRQGSGSVIQGTLRTITGWEGGRGSQVDDGRLA